MKNRTNRTQIYVKSNKSNGPNTRLDNRMDKLDTSRGVERVKTGLIVLVFDKSTKSIVPIK